MAKVGPAKQEIQQMEAAVINNYGKEALKLTQISIPILKAKHVLVRVHAVSIQPADVKTRSGSIKVMNGKPTKDNPCVLGYDCAGTIKEVGPDVVNWKVGDEVMCVAKYGALCQYTLVSESQLARKPANIEFAQAAALVTSGLTSLQAFVHAKNICTSDNQDKSDVLKRVFITAGSGGCGSVAIQMAKKVFKADVVATTASESKTEFVKSCGADVVIDYKKEKFEKDLLAKCGGEKFDMALDCTGETAKCKKIVRKGGSIVSILGVPNGKMLSKVVDAYELDKPPKCIFGLLDCVNSCSGNNGVINIHNLIMIPSGKELDEVGKLVGDEIIKITIDRVYPLAKVVEAFDYVEQGHVVGRVVVECFEGSCGNVTQRNKILI